MEIWRDVLGYERYYEVSNIGRVRNKITGNVLKNNLRKNGYLSVDLAYGNKRTFSVHRLVAQAFLKNLDELPCVNHKNENKMDNRAVNLEWCTHKYNANYGLGSKARNSPIVQLDTSGNLVGAWESIKLAEERTGIRYQNISAVCRGVNHTAGGFTWRYDRRSKNIATS